jgi:hypothetical protein
MKPFMPTHYPTRSEWHSIGKRPSQLRPGVIETTPDLP